MLRRWRIAANVSGEPRTLLVQRRYWTRAAAEESCDRRNALAGAACADIRYFVVHG